MAYMVNLWDAQIIENAGKDRAQRTVPDGDEDGSGRTEVSLP